MEEFDPYYAPTKPSHQQQAPPAVASFQPRQQTRKYEDSDSSEEEEDDDEDEETECESTDDESDANSEARKRDDDVERVFGNGGRTGNQSASSNSGLKVYNGIVDPSKCYMLSYTKENVGKRIRRSKYHIMWELMIDGEVHTVELSHSQFTGKKKVWVDTVRMLNFNDKTASGLFYKHSEMINGHEIALRIISARDLGHVNPLLWKYQVFIDGENAANLDQRRRRREFYSS